MSGSIALNTLSSIYDNSFTQYLKYSEIIGGYIFEQSISVNNVFKYTLELIETFSKYRNPLNPSAEQDITNPLFQEISQVIAFESRATDFIFQITLISKSIKIFEWVKESEVEVFVGKLHKYVQFYQQKAQCEIEGLGRTHFEWLKCWNETYEEFSIFILNFFKNGITWSGHISLPLNNVLGDSHIVERSVEHQALLNDINKGETIQDMLHHPIITEESPTVSKVFTKLDQKWLIQNQKNRHKDLVLNTARKEDNICICNCEDCTVVIESFVNIIRLNICRRVTILFRHASKVEVVDSKDCNLHCFEKISELDMKSCENCGIYLSDKSLDCSILTAKCSGINVNFPFEDGLYQSFRISDQLKTTILPNRGIETYIKL